MFVASEAEPFARAGGLGSVMYSLPMAMKEIGFDARLMIPRYLNVDEKLYNLEMEVEGLKIPTSNTHGEHFLICNVKKYTGQPQANTPVTTYFLENQEYYEQRANIYGYSDDPSRCALLSRSVR